MDDVYTKAVELLEKGKSSVLATIIRLVGSGPRHTGTKFLIMEDGSHVGTIGGGRLEAQVLEGAKQVFSTNCPARLTFNLRGKDVAESDMICGGDAEVFLEPLRAERMDHVAIFKKLLDIQKRGGKGIMATLLHAEAWKGREIPKVFMKEDGEQTGSIAPFPEAENKLAQEAGEFLAWRQAGIIAIQDSQGRPLELFVEPVVSDPVLYVFGGGHVSSQIVPLASRVGFKVVVIDDRPEFADPKKFPEAAEAHQYPFEGVFKKLPVNEFSFLVIVTRGHIHDKTVLVQSLKTDARYIGMIGSRRKIAMVFDSLKEEGFTQEDIDRVHAPIGLDIGAETPEEIAVSIVAELISVRAGKGMRMR